MADQSNRLTKSSGYSIVDIIRISRQYYKSPKGDDKAKRARMDVTNARVTNRNNYEYNPSTKSWEQTGRNVRIDFLIKTYPISYKKTDNIKVHKYPVTFLIEDINLGIFSTFKWRTGSLKKPIFKNPSLSSKQIAEKNIKNQVQLQFVYDLMWVLRKHNLLFGRSWVTRPPLKTNPKMTPFFDKHAWWIVSKFLVRMLGKDGGIVKASLIK
mgnify:CR=1 FL=1